MKVLSTNILANHPAYGKIIATYNRMLKEEGSVNNKNFYETIVLPEIPGYKMSNWYKFLNRFKTEAGIVPVSPIAPVVIGDSGKELAATMLSNQQATAKLIQSMLNISADAAAKIADDPSLLTAKERAELGLKAMKAQDSRIHAVGKLREDNREQERFERAFDGAAYEG